MHNYDTWWRIFAKFELFIKRIRSHNFQLFFFLPEIAGSVRTRIVAKASEGKKYLINVTIRMATGLQELNDKTDLKLSRI